MNQNAGIRNKLILWALCLCLALGAAFAVAEPAEPVTETPVVTADTVTPAVNDTQAAAGFITQVMTGRKLTPPKPRGTVSGDQLTGREALLYEALKAKIQQAAAGQLDSTQFQIPLKDIYENVHYTAEQLGVDYIYDYDTSSWNDAAFDAFNALNVFDFERLNRALLYDLPYDLYWYDKTAGSSYSGGGSSSDGSTVYFSDYENGMLTFSYKVSSDYAVGGASGGYALDTSYGARAVTAAENARSVVNDNEGKSDLHKLQAYKEYICGEVTYNTAAADDKNNTPYGDPWQLVNVFDGDPETNVVCEGYSKAFQFLCDESRFRNGTSVISVTGTMAGGTGQGAHMWNIVTMPDGLHYMADITNSDAGTVGADGGLFLSGCTSHDPVNNQYNYTAGNRMIAYKYDDITLQLLNETGRLAMANADYVPSDLDVDIPVVTEITLLDTPSSIVLGEDLPVGAVFPGDSGPVEIQILKRLTGDSIYSINTSLWDSTSIRDKFQAHQLIQTGMVPGSYTIEIRWLPPEEDWTTEEGWVIASFPLEVTGTAPEMPKVDALPSNLTAGETIHLSGRAGSAESIRIEWNYDGHGDSWSGWLYQDAVLDGEGGWSCDISAPVAGSYTFDIYGRKGTLSTGFVQACLFVSDDASLPAPQFESEYENDAWIITFRPGADAGQEEVAWYVIHREEYAGRSNYSRYYTEEDGSCQIWIGDSEFEENHTIQAAYQIGGVWSFPATWEGHTDGRPWPVNGPVPLNLDVPDALPAGQDLTLSWEPEVDGQSLELDFYRLEATGENHLKSLYADENESDLTIPGTSLAEGNYMLHAVSRADTYENSEQDFEILVSMNPDQPAAPVVTLDPEQPTSADEIAFSFATPFEDMWFELYMLTSDSPDMVWFWHHTDHSAYQYTYRYAIPAGEWRIKAWVKENGLWSHPFTTTFTVTEAPSVGEIRLAGDLPEIDLFRSFSITLQPSTNATRYFATLMYDVGSDEDGFYSEIAAEAQLNLDAPATGPVTLTLEDWSDDAQPTNFWLWIEAGADGYNTSTGRFDGLTVNQVERPAAPTEIQLLDPYDGSPLPEEEWTNLLPGRYGLRVNHTRPFRNLRLELWRHADGEDYRQNEWRYEDEGSLSWYAYSLLSLNSEGDWSIRIQAMIDDTLSLWSDFIPLRVIPMPQLAAPTVSLSKETLTIGEDLILTVTDIDPDAEYIIVRNVTGEYYEMTVWDLTEPVTVTVPETYFSAGANTFRVIAAADRAKGGITEKTVQVTGQRPAAPDVVFSTTSAALGDDYFIQVTAPGADVVEMDGNMESGLYGLRNGTVRIPMQIWYYSSRSQSYRFRARINGVWSAWTDYTRVTSTTPRPTLPDQNFVILPEAIVPGQDVEFTFLPVEGADQYYINIMHDHNYLCEIEYYAPGKVTLPANLFAEGGTFGFDIGAGVESAPDLIVRGRTYTVAPWESPAAPLVISASKTELAYRESVTVSLNGQAADQVIVQRSQNGVWTDPILFERGEGSPLTDVEFSYYQTGEVPIRVCALINGAWTGWSESLILHYAERPTVNLPQPLARVAAEITEGQPIPISWDAVPGADSYSVHWYSMTAESGSLMADGPSASIPASACPAGEWWVYVRSMAGGAESDSTVIQVPFTVVPDDNPPVVITRILTLPADLTEIEAEAFAGTDAQRIVLPASCAAVGSRAFADSDSLVEVIVPGAGTIIPADAFDGCGQTVTLRLPAGNPSAAAFRDNPKVTVLPLN